MTEPPLEPPEPCGCGQCEGRCTCERDPDDEYDQWVDQQIEEREDDRST